MASLQPLFSSVHSPPAPTPALPLNVPQPIAATEFSRTVEILAGHFPVVSIALSPSTKNLLVELQASP